MKNVKRVLGMLLATIMVLTLTMPVFATDVTISGKGNKFAAFKLADRETNANDPSVFIYKVNPKYRDALKTFVNVPANATEAEIDAAILDYLDQQQKAGDTAVRTFADALFALIDVDDPEAEIETKGTNYTFTGLDEGYYMFVETEVAEKEVNGDTVTEDEISQVILTPVYGDTMTVETKEDEVTSDKKLRDINDSEETEPTDWQDGADYDIGDHVPYRLTGTVSANYDAYDKYFFKFYDEMSAGLDFDDNVTVYLMRKNAQGTLEKVGDITTGYKVEKDAADPEHKFTVTFDDLKTVSPKVQAGDTIVVEFTAMLNENAVIGAGGNTNQSRVEYSNNPYDEDDHGFTPWDIVIVFTYKLVVNKVDAAGEAVEDAGFTLYKYNAETEEYEAVGAELTGAQMTTFTWTGIDDGTYKLVETTVPAGYNKADDIIFKVVADHDTIGDKPVLKSLTVTDEEGNVLSNSFEITLSQGQIATDVVNNSGVELPRTGGMGTTIFYVLGTIMMIGAGVILVTRRRVR